MRIRFHLAVVGLALALPAAAFGADTKPPKIAHTPINEAPAGKALPVSATITDDSEIFEPTLSYRAAGTKRFLSASMSKGAGNTFTATIPDVAMTGTVEYFLEAYDANGNGPARFASDAKPHKIKTTKAAESKITEATPPPPPPEAKPEDKPAEAKPETTVAQAQPAEAKPAETKPAGGLTTSNQVSRRSESGATGPMSIAGYSAIGVGLVGVGLGAYFGVDAKAQRDKAQSDPVATSAKASLNGANSSALIANVCFVAGGVVAAAGVALAVIPLVTDSSGRASLMIGPSSVTYALTF